MRGYFDEGQEVADLVVGEFGDETEFIERFEWMFVGVEEDVVDLAGREEMELGEFFFGGMIQVNRRFVKSIEVRLQLLVVDFAEFGDGVVDIEDDVINGHVRNQ